MLTATETPYTFEITRQMRAVIGPNYEYSGNVPGGDVINVTDAQTGAVVASQISTDRAARLYGFVDPLDVGPKLIYHCARCGEHRLAPVTEARFRWRARQPSGPLGPIVCEACSGFRAAALLHSSAL